MVSQLLETRAEEGPRRLALGFLDEARAAAERLHDPEDDEALHDFRVALRRLRSCLRAYARELGPSVGKKLQRQLRRLASRTGPGRDAEVQLTWVERVGAELPSRHKPGVRWLANRLDEKKGAAYDQVLNDLYDRFGKLERRLRKRLETYSLEVRVGESRGGRPFSKLAADAIEVQLEALTSELSRVRGLEDEAKAHQARIYGKRLRYLLEPLKGELQGAREVIKHLKVLQDVLGDLNDLHNLATTVGEGLERAAVKRARRLRDAALEEPDGQLDRVLRADERPGLLGLLKRIQSDRAERFSSLIEVWVSEDGHLESLGEEVRRLIDALRDHDRAPGSEIERKFLLDALPAACEGLEAVEMDQGYLPGEQLIERVRRKRSLEGERHIRTVKLGAGLSRIEVEEECSPEVFATLFSLTEGRRVQKRRFRVPEGEHVWEIDEFSDRELVLAEIELASAEEVVELPEWLAPNVVREVTDEPEYLNLNLSR